MEIIVKTSKGEKKFTLNEKELAKSTILDLKGMLHKNIQVREEKMKIHYKNAPSGKVMSDDLLIKNVINQKDGNQFELVLPKSSGIYHCNNKMCYCMINGTHVLKLTPEQFKDPKIKKAIESTKHLNLEQNKNNVGKDQKEFQRELNMDKIPKF